MRKIFSPTLLFLSPWLMTLILFWLFPLIYSLYLSFTDYTVLNPYPNFIGVQNYLNLFSDPDFLTALKNTSLFVAGTIPFTTIIALFLALIVNQKIPLKDFFRAGFFLPSITSMVVIALIFTNLYSKDGYLTFLCHLLGIPTPEKGFLFSTSTALPSIMLMDVWVSFGYYLILYLAALQAIPQELYEAAEISGASFWQKFRYITLPYLRPMTLLIVLLNTIRSFQIFIEIFVMTKGGPLNSTLTVVYSVYENGLVRFQMGYASAMAYVLFFIIMIFSLLQMKVFGLGKGVEE
ncbi:MAG: ABC transporter permease [candidate division Zixibacteria bacterium RBG_19FT_COMBO_42_43]|nr:MAG: ABC transporter permease [candidate division Zixibacteria bacterium RBG_19FT_COMBO_42_43]